MSRNEGDAAFLIAADAGGTYSRVACFGLDGRMLGFATGGGGSPFHQADAQRNVADTTERALAAGGLDAADAVGLVAGLAMVSRARSNQGDGDNAWAEDFFRVPGLTCERRILNDAVVAHRGALLGDPGVIVVAGTGSMILGIDADGVEVESGQFEHYAGAARHLVYEAVQLALTGRIRPGDEDLLAAMCAHWGAADVPELRAALLDDVGPDRMAVRHHYGAFAPTVTAAADDAPLADLALRWLADRTARGVLLLAPLVEPSGETVRVATTGGLAGAAAFTARLAAALGDDARLAPPALDALRGAALIGLSDAHVGVRADDALVGMLRASQTQGD